jgi:hypothetical protein
MGAARRNIYTSYTGGENNTTVARPGDSEEK